MGTKSQFKKKKEEEKKRDETKYGVYVQETVGTRGQ